MSERRARDEAERQSRIKDEFLATLSHELRTPMNAILGWLNMLTTGKGLRSPEKAIAVIERNAQLQARLIEDLLEMNKLTSGTVRLDIAPLDLVATLDAAMESLKPTAETKDVRLAVEMPSAMPRIPADARRVQQILWNVLHNAVKFTRPGGQVAVRATRGRRAGCGFRWRTRGRAFRRSSCRMCSIASVRPIRPARAKPGASASASRSRSISSSSTAARSRRPVPA